jgi:hypothetical protein
MQFWLKNRKPEDWKEKTEVAVSFDAANIIAEGRRRVRELRDTQSKETAIETEKADGTP